jgi:hypothetical protein
VCGAKNTAAYKNVVVLLLRLGAIQSKRNLKCSRLSRKKTEQTQKNILRMVKRNKEYILKPLLCFKAG